MESRQLRLDDPNVIAPQSAVAPSHLYCETCAKREWGPGPHDVLQLKLRDFLGATALSGVPCLSVCPERGLTTARKTRAPGGRSPLRTRVLSLEELAKVETQFDPTRQLSLFSLGALPPMNAEAVRADRDKDPAK